MTIITGSMPGYTTSPVRGESTFNSDLQTRMNEMAANATALNTISGEINTIIGEINSAASDVESNAAAAAESESNAAESEAMAAAYAAALIGTSTTSITVGNGSKEFAIQADKQFVPGMFVLTTRTSDPDVYMHGRVSSYASTNLTVDVTSFEGSGAYSDWTISISGPRGDTGSSSFVDIVDDTTPQLGGPLDTAGQQVQFSKGDDIASASILVVPTDGNFFDVTGTTTITAISMSGNATTVKLRFDSALTLIHSSSLVLPGGVDLNVSAGEVIEFTKVDSAVVLTGRLSAGDRVLLYQIDATAASEVVFDDITNAFRAYIIESDDFSTSAIDTILFRVGTGSAPTYQTTGYSYSVRYQRSNATTISVDNNTSALYGEIGIAPTVSSDAGSLKIEISDPSSTTKRTAVRSSTLVANATSTVQFWEAFCSWTGITPVTAFKMYSTTITITGAFKFYGVV